MKPRIWPSLFLLICFCLVSIAGCSFLPPKGKAADTGFREVTDEAGTSVQVPLHPHRVYASTYSLEEILSGLLPPEDFASISETMTDPEQSLIADKASQVRTKVPDRLSVEQIAALHPDLIILQVMEDPAKAQTLRDMGLTVYVTQVPVTLPQIETHIQNIAGAVNQKAAGDQMVAEMEKKLTAVHQDLAKVPDSQRKTLMAYSAHGVFGSSGGLFDSLCQEAGIRNGAALAGLVKNGQLSKEAIIHTNPDILLFPEKPVMVKGDTDKLKAEVLHDPSLQTVNAIRNGQVMEIKDRYRYACSQFAADAVWIMAHDAYPEYVRPFEE